MFDKPGRVTAFRLEGQKLGGEPPFFFFCFSAFTGCPFSKFGVVFFDFECCEFAKSRFELQLFSHF